MFNKMQLDNSISRIARSPACTGPAVQVLHHFAYDMNKINMVRGTPAELAKHCRMKILQFNLGIKNLKQLNIIRKYTKREYMLNPDYAYNGDDKRYFIIKSMWDNQTTLGLRKE